MRIKFRLSAGRWMARGFALLLLVYGAMSPAKVAAASIGFSVVELGANWLRYDYSISGFDLLKNQEIDIRFDPAVYGGLANGVAGADFDLLLLQPNNPPGTFGSWGILALVDHPSWAGTFRVDALYKGAGEPAPLPYFINRYDPQGKLLSSEGADSAAPVGETIPEPSTWMLAGLGAACGVALRAARRRGV
jgi:hypothetical protein